MKFKVEVMRSAVVAGLAAVLLASCGGGTQIESFVPRRVIAFGDEASIVTPAGTKYTVNGVVFNTTTNIPADPTVANCLGSQVWVQILGYSFGIAFPGCPTAGMTTSGVMRALPAARAADISAQVSNFLAGDAFGKNDLVSLMVGTNDIVALYESQADPIANAQTLIDAAQRAGDEVGAQVVRITDQGAKVIVSTIPNVGFTPYAAREEAAHPGEGRGGLLSTLAAQFNSRLRLKLQDVRDGGHAVGLVLADDMVYSMVRSPATFGLTNITSGACQPNPAVAVDLLVCDVVNVVDAAQPTYAGDWLWADQLRMAPNAQARLGSLAVSRARGNPF